MSKFLNFVKRPFVALMSSIIIAAIVLGTTSGIVLGGRTKISNPEVNMSNPSRTNGTGLVESSKDNINSAPSMSEKDGVIHAKSANDANAFLTDVNGDKVWSTKYIFTTTMKLNDFALSQSAIKRAGVLAAYVDKDEFLIFFIDINGSNHEMTFAVDGPRNGGSGVGGWRFEGVTTPAANFDYFGEIKITVVKDTQDLYIFVNDVFVYHKNKLYGSTGEAQPGFHNRMTDVHYSNYSVITDEEEVDRFISLMRSSETNYFGKHMIDAVGDESFIYDSDTKTFRLPKTSILRGGYYYLNKMTPLYHESYIFQGNVCFQNMGVGAGFEIHITQEAKDRLRFMFHAEGSNIKIASDVSNGGNPAGYETIGTAVLKQDNSFDLKIINHKSTFSLIVNGEYVYSVQKVMTNPHLGLFASNTGILLSDFNAETRSSVVKDTHLGLRKDNNIPFGKNTFDNSGSDTLAVLTDDNMYRMSAEGNPEYTYFLYRNRPLQGNNLSAEFELTLSDIAVNGYAEFVFKFQDGNKAIDEIKWQIHRVDESTYGTRAVRPDGSIQNASYTFAKEEIFVSIVAYQNVYAFLIDSNLVDDYIMDSTNGAYNINQFGIGVVEAQIEIGDFTGINLERYVRRVVGKARYQEGPLPFGKHSKFNLGADDLFVDLQDTTYEAVSTSYTEQYYYEKGVEAIAGNKYMMKGVMEIKSNEPWAQAIVELVHNENNRIRYVLERTDDRRFQVFTDQRVNGVFSGWTEVVKVGAATNIVEFTIITDNGRYFFIMNNKVMHYRELNIGETHVAFGIEKGAVNLSKLRGTKDQELIEIEMSKLDKSDAFKKHAYINYGVAGAINYDKNSEKYVFDRTTWGDSYHYEAGAIPTGGKYYAISFEIDITRINGNIEIQAVQADNHKIRWVLQRSGNAYKLYTDYRNKGNFAGWQQIVTDITLSSTINLEIIHNNGAFMIVVNGLSAHLQNLDMPKSQIGIGAGNAAFTLSDVQSTTDQAMVVSKYNSAVALIEEKINPFKGEDGKLNGTFAHVGNNVFRMEQNASYKEAFVYGDTAMATSLNGSAMLFSSTLKLAGEVDSVFDYRFVNAAGDSFQLSVSPVGGKLRLSATKTISGVETAMAEFAQEVNSLSAVIRIIVKDDTYYLVVNGALIAKQTIELGNVRMSVGGEKVTVDLSAVISTKQASRIDDAINEVEYVGLPYPFGKNFYKNSGSTTAFVDNKDYDSYTKSSAGYAESFYYKDGVTPVAGNKYMLKASINFDAHDGAGLKQSVILLDGGNNRMIRIVLEKLGDGKHQVFADYNPGTGFKGWKLLYAPGNIGNKMTVTIVVDADTAAVYMLLEGSKKYLTTLNASYMGADIPVNVPTHIGFAGENGNITISQVTSSVDDSEVDAMIEYFSGSEITPHNP